MKKLFAGAGKLAGVVGIKTSDMRDFLNNISGNLEIKRESFTNHSGEFIEYDNYEIVKTLAYYESYQAELDKLANKAVKTAILNTALPEVNPIVMDTPKKGPKAQPPEKMRIDPPEIDVNKNEIPF